MAFTDKILSPLLSPLKRALKERSGAIPKLVQTGAEQLGLTKSMKTFSDFFERGPRVKPSVRPPVPIGPAPVVPPKRRDDDVMTATSAPVPEKTPVVAAPPKSDISFKAPVAPGVPKAPAVPKTFAELAETPGALVPSARAKPPPVPVPMPKAPATKKRVAAKAKSAATAKKPAAAAKKPAAKAKPVAKKPTAKKPVAKKATAKAKPTAKKPAAKAPAVASDYPLLSVAAKKQKLVLAGGMPKKPIQTWLEGLVGTSVHWTDTSSTGTRSVAGLELAIQRGGVTALILLEGSISHTESERVIAACKKAKVPLARGKRGGRQSLKDALASLEKAFKKSAK